MNVHFVSLGCPKNRVDTEVMLGHTADAGHSLVDAPEAADVIVVNTCGFIGEAKEESIDTILEMAAPQGGGDAASGWSSPAACRSATRRSWRPRCPRSTTSSAPTRSARSRRRIAGDDHAPAPSPTRPRYLYDDAAPRRRSQAAHSAYVKIAEGCDRPCAFCIIPKLRGPQRSRTPESVVREARDLVAGGARRST